MGIAWKLVQAPSCYSFYVYRSHQGNIIQNFGAWYGSNHEGFVTIFANPTYLHLYDNESNDEEPNEDDIEEPWVVNMGGLLTLDDTSPDVEEKKDHNQPLISNARMEKCFCPNGWCSARNHQ
jgi:hypothetical protein